MIESEDILWAFAVGVFWWIFWFTLNGDSTQAGINAIIGFGVSLVMFWYHNRKDCLHSKHKKEGI